MAGMREGPWSSLSMGKKVALAVGLPIGATVGYLVYHLFRNSNAQKEGTEESRMIIPLEVYRSIARHQGSFLDLVGQQSGAQVKVVSESGEQSSVCFLLKGSAEQVFLARCALDRMASDCEVITDIMEVPQTAFGRIIGRGGESLKLICRTSGARVTCPRDRSRNLGEKGKVSIVGTRQEVRNAREMIMEKVVENEEVRRRISQSSSLRQKRRPPEPEVQRSKQAEDVPKQELAVDKPQSSKSGVESKGPVQVNGTTVIPDSDAVITEEPSKPEGGENGDCTPLSPLGVSKFEIPSPDLSFQPDEHLEVYVSAVENPQHFWIQILGIRSLQLDKLTAEMNRFYGTGSPSEQKVQAVVVGDIVAAPYRDHGTWNRARVLGVLESGLVDLYYVDFGDNGELPPDSLRRMRSDFLSLPFQAIECSLAGVCPAGETWTEEALDEFDRLTYCAQWKPLLAKLCSYSHSEISSWPSVQLYDNNHGKALDLGEELIRRGHAVCYQDDGGLRGDRDDPGSLQKMLDDVTGATSELSLSCISLSVSPVETHRADVDHSPSIMFIDSSLSYLDSTPSHLGVSELQALLSPSPIPAAESPDQLASEGSVYLQSKTYTVTIPHLQSSSILSCSSESSSCVEAVSSALMSLALCDDVFLSEASTSAADGGDFIPISSDSEETGCSGSVCTDSYQDESSSGIRSVWYHLSSSEDSSISSPSTSLPPSTSSSSHLSESQSRIPISSSSSLGGSSLDLSGSVQGSQEIKMEVLASTAEKGDGRLVESCCSTLVELNDCSHAVIQLIKHSSAESEVCLSSEGEAGCEESQQVTRKKTRKQYKRLNVTEDDSFLEERGCVSLTTQQLVETGVTKSPEGGAGSESSKIRENITAHEERNKALVLPRGRTLSGSLDVCKHKDAWTFQERPGKKASHDHSQQQDTDTPISPNSPTVINQATQQLGLAHMSKSVLNVSRPRTEVASISGSVDDVIEDESM